MDKKKFFHRNYVAKERHKVTLTQQSSGIKWLSNGGKEIALLDAEKKCWSLASILKVIHQFKCNKRVKGTALHPFLTQHPIDHLSMIKLETFHVKINQSLQIVLQFSFKLTTIEVQFLKRVQQACSESIGDSNYSLFVRPFFFCDNWKMELSL